MLVKANYKNTLAFKSIAKLKKKNFFKKFIIKIV